MIHILAWHFINSKKNQLLPPPMIIEHFLPMWRDVCNICKKIHSSCHWFGCYVTFSVSGLLHVSTRVCQQYKHDPSLHIWWISSSLKCLEARNIENCTISQEMHQFSLHILNSKSWNCRICRLMIRDFDNVVFDLDLSPDQN